MRLYPTENAVHVTVAGALVFGAGLAVGEPAIVAWGGALLAGVALARSVTWVSIARIRAAGFEMLWREPSRSRRVLRGETVSLAAEVRNRDTRAARFDSLRVVASPHLDIEVTPSSGEVPAGGRLAVTIRARPTRVGRHGIFGLSLEARGGPGLFEVPLTFANPLGIEAYPATYWAMLRTARGGRSRTATDAGRSGPLSGDGYELREIREHRAGDPLKRVAWKASARRGKLLVRDHEQEERDVVWLVVDASVELWAGVSGSAPLDHAIDEAAAVADAHIAEGDHVGLVVCGSGILARIRPGKGPRQAAEIAAALVSRTTTLDEERSGLDPEDVAVRVLEHLRTQDAAAAAGARASDRAELAERVQRVLGRAPFGPEPHRARDAADAVLRSYLGAFGIPAPPKLEPERARADETMAEFLSRLTEERPRPSLVYVWSPAPDPERRPALALAVQRHARHRLQIRWVRLELEQGLHRGGGAIAAAARHAVALRAGLAETVGERALRRLGVTVERVQKRRASPREATQAVPQDPP